MLYSTVITHLCPLRQTQQLLANEDGIVRMLATIARNPVLVPVQPVSLGYFIAFPPQ